MSDEAQTIMRSVGLSLAIKGTAAVEIEISSAGAGASITVKVIQ